MQAVTRTTNYISETAQRTIALNLAKEGIEAVYNIRNTNWRRRSSQRNQCWLKADPMVDETDGGVGFFGDTRGRQIGCQDDVWLRTGRWVIHQRARNGEIANVMEPILYYAKNQASEAWLKRDVEYHNAWKNVALAADLAQDSQVLDLDQAKYHSSRFRRFFVN